MIAHTSEIGVGESKIFQYPGDANPCILVRTGVDSYVAYSRLCTHVSCAVFYNRDQQTFDCPCHGGVYSVADGSVLDGPPPHPLPRIELQIRGSDIVATGVHKS